jgi:hypothetical protein
MDLQQSLAVDRRGMDMLEGFGESIVRSTNAAGGGQVEALRVDPDGGEGLVRIR